MPQSGAHSEASGTAINAQSVAAVGGTANADIVTSGFSTLTVMAIEQGTATGSDLVLAVRPYEADGLTLLRESLPSATSAAPAVASGTPDSVVTTQTFDLRGIAKVNVLVTNNNAFAAKNVTVQYFLAD